MFCSECGQAEINGNFCWSCGAPILVLAKLTEANEDSIDTTDNSYEELSSKQQEILNHFAKYLEGFLTKYEIGEDELFEDDITPEQIENNLIWSRVAEYISSALKPEDEDYNFRTDEVLKAGFDPESSIFYLAKKPFTDSEFEFFPYTTLILHCTECEGGCDRCKQEGEFLYTASWIGNKVTFDWYQY